MFSNAQTWTVIGALAAFMVGVLTLMATSFNGQIGGLREEVRGSIDGLRQELRVRFESVDRRLDGLDRRLDRLDTDVQAITNRVFRDP